MTTLSTLLQTFMQRAQVGSRTLSHLTGIPRTSIDNWRDGSAQRPKHWSPLLQIAQALALSAAEADTLLAAAGHPSVARLASTLALEHPDRRYLQPWLAPTPLAPEVTQRLQALEAQFVESNATPAPPRHQLRAPAADFVGRTDAIKTLLNTLGHASGGAVAAISGVRGMGGIGKTELAYVIAHQLRGTYPDAQIVVNLRGASATPLPPAQALQQVIHAFMPNVQLPDDIDALQQRYCAALHGQRALILADDARDATQVQPLLPPPGCALLVTSRQRFALPGMTTIDLEQLEVEAAVALVQGICDRLTVGEAQTLARACGYLPLALRISASILQSDPALPVATYLGHLMDEQQRLAQLCDPDNPTLDVEDTLALSYTQLEHTAQQIFRQLAVFSGDFATELALAVVEALPNVDIEATLRLLLRRNLLMYDAQRSRWRMHNLVRDLARGYLEMMREWEATQWRYAQAAVAIAQKTRAHYLAGGEGALAALAWFDAERPHLDAARRWAMCHAATLAGDRLLLEVALATDCIGKLRYDVRHERIPLWEDACAAAERLGKQHAQAQALDQLGLSYLALGAARHATPYLEQALTIARALNDRQLEGGILNKLGIACYVVGDAQRALLSFQQSLTIARILGDQRMEAAALNNMGEVYLELGYARCALPYYEQVFAIAHALGDRHVEVASLGNLGNAYTQLGDIQHAISYLEQGITIARKFNDRLHEGIILGTLANTYMRVGEVGRANAVCKQALEQLRALGAQREEGDVLCTLGASYAALGKQEHARSAFEAALSLFDAIDNCSGTARCQWAWGLRLVGWGAREQALPLLRAALAYEQEIGHAKANEHAALITRLEAGEALPADLLNPVSQRAVGVDTQAFPNMEAAIHSGTRLRPT